MSDCLAGLLTCYRLCLSSLFYYYYGEKVTLLCKVVLLQTYSWGFSNGFTPFSLFNSTLRNIGGRITKNGCKGSKIF